MSDRHPDDGRPWQEVLAEHAEAVRSGDQTRIEAVIARDGTVTNRRFHVPAKLVERARQETLEGARRSLLTSLAELAPERDTGEPSEEPEGTSRSGPADDPDSLDPCGPAQAKAVELGPVKPGTLAPKGRRQAKRPSQPELRLTSEAEAGLRLLETVGRSFCQASDEADQPEELPRFMKVAQYAEYLKVSTSSVYHWIRLGLPNQRLGPRLVRIKVQEADDWLANDGPSRAIGRSAKIRSRTRKRKP